MFTDEPPYCIIPDGLFEADRGEVARLIRIMAASRAWARRSPLLRRFHTGTG